MGSLVSNGSIRSGVGAASSNRVRSGCGPFGILNGLDDGSAMQDLALDKHIGQPANGGLICDDEVTGAVHQPCELDLDPLAKGFAAAGGVGSHRQTRAGCQPTIETPVGARFGEHMCGRSQIAGRSGVGALAEELVGGPPRELDDDHVLQLGDRRR